MAAGLGFKTFTTGEVLTAGDVNGYLMQGINVFANATARDAAITSPQEGQFAFTKDNNSLWYYDGAAWVASGATGDIEGVTAGVGISGGGTSGTVTITNSMATAIDAKGDLIPGTGADTFARLAVGANDTVLTADSTTATGLKWAAASGGGLTVLASGSLPSGTLSLTSINSTYVDLKLVIRAFRTGDNGDFFRMRFNNDTGGSYATTSAYNQNPISIGNTQMNIFGIGQNNTIATGFSVTDIFNYANTTVYKTGRSYTMVNNQDSVDNVGLSQVAHFWDDTAAINRIDVYPFSGTFATGTYTLYGVK